MSSVFQFVLGITLGILITLTLVHRYKKADVQFPINTSPIVDASSTSDVSPGSDSVRKFEKQLTLTEPSNVELEQRSDVKLNEKGAISHEEAPKSATMLSSSKKAESLKVAHGWLADAATVDSTVSSAAAAPAAGVGFSDEALQQQVRMRAGGGRRAKRGKQAPALAEGVEPVRPRPASGGISVRRDVVPSTDSTEDVDAPTATKPGTVAQKGSWVPGREGAFLNFKNTDGGSGTGEEVDFVAAKGADASATAVKAVEPSAAIGEISEMVDTAARKKGRKGRRRERGQGRDPAVAESSGSTTSTGGSASSGDTGEIANEFGLGIIDPAASVERVSKGLTAGTAGISRSSASSAVTAAATSGSSSDDIKVQSQFFNSEGERISVDDLGKYSGQLYASPPLIPYHAQARRPALQPPYIPSLQSVKAQKAALTYKPDTVVTGMSKELPNMALQKAVFEPENLKLHLCNGVFEAYSASYLTTKQHMLEVKSEQYNLTWVNCEMASFIHMRESKNFLSNPKGQGMIIQSLDVLDFSAIHLSAYERSSKKYRHRLWKSKAEQKTEWTKIEPVKETARILEEKINPKKTGKPLVWSPEAKRTVVIMPFLGGAMGAGHSELGNRFEYLRACFWSFYEFIPNIVAGVTRKEDVEWGMKHSGLPFYEMILIENLPKGAGLPVATTQRTKAKLLSGEWDFDYVFFTESDQILISRQLPMMYDHLKKYPSRMILPHRLMPYSDRVMKEVHSKNIDETHNKWMQESCCLPRQNCEERKTWRPLNDPSIPVINYYGLYVPLGNVNFLMEEYRGCKMSSYIGDYCP